MGGAAPRRLKEMAKRIDKIIQLLGDGPALLHEIKAHIGGTVREDDIVATLRLGIRTGRIARTEIEGQVAYKLANDGEAATPVADAAPAVVGQGNNTDSDDRGPSSFGLGDVAAHETHAPADSAGSGTPDAGAGESVRTTHVLKVIDEIRAALPGGDGLDLDGLARSVSDLRSAIVRQETMLRAEREACEAMKKVIKQQNQIIDDYETGIQEWNEKAIRDTAKGYLVRAPKRRLRVCKRGELAVQLAKAAAKNGSVFADVFALVPMGRAVRGAEWRDAE